MNQNETDSTNAADVRAVREIRDLIENWVVRRDAALWDEFAQVWHSAGHMSATWFQGSARDFIDVSREGFDRGVRILHFLGGSSVQVSGNRAVAQTKMTITQRAAVHDVEVDVVCTGRFYDFLAVEHGAWKLVRRQPIYERDRMDAVDPAATLELDRHRLLAWPEGYRHLAYLQAEVGYSIKGDLPGLTGPAVEQLYAEGTGWLAGSERPGVPA
jgi:hypothetical protein